MDHLSLITNSKMTLKNIVREVLSAHDLISNYINHGNIKNFLEFRAIFQLLTMTVINLSYPLSTLASYLSWVTAQHRNRASTELVSVTQGNHLSREASCSYWWVIFCCQQQYCCKEHLWQAHCWCGGPQCSLEEISSQHHSTRLYFGCDIDWKKGEYHARTESASLFSAYWDSTNTINFYKTLGEVHAKAC